MNQIPLGMLPFREVLLCFHGQFFLNFLYCSIRTKKLNNLTQKGNAVCVKGQLISECLFEKIVWTKIPTKNLIDSAQQRLLLQG